MKQIALALTVTTIASQASAAPMILESISYSGSTQYVLEAPSNLFPGSTFTNWVSNENATWDFSDGIIHSTGLVERMGFTSPPSNIYSVVGFRFVDLSFDLSGPLGLGSVSAASFECIEGDIGALVSNNLCGNYATNNGGDESTTAYNVNGNPRNTVVTLGGDDSLLGLPASLSLFDIASYSWNDSTLVITTTDTPEGNTFYFTFTSVAPVPVPAAAWLFGSALLSLVSLKRKK